jgi:hypothetical protein
MVSKPGKLIGNPESHEAADGRPGHQKQKGDHVADHFAAPKNRVVKVINKTRAKVIGKTTITSNAKNRDVAAT